MKKITLFLSALALLAGFSSCEKKPAAGEEEFILDGFYVYGEATCLDKVAEKGMFSKGINDLDSKKVVPGLWDKYVALQGGKTFVLAEVKGAQTIEYGSEDLKDVKLDGHDWSINTTAKEGAIKEGATLKVAKDGMYQIIVNAPAKKVTLLPVEKWSMNNNGVPTVNAEGETEWNRDLKPVKFDKNQMVFKIENAEMTKTFKFQHNQGWKYFVDEKSNPKVAVGTNFGAKKLLYDGSVNTTLETLGDDIKIPYANKAKYTVELIWTMSKGLGYTCKLTKTGTVELPDPATFKLGIIGLGGDWNNDKPFTYVAGTKWEYAIENIKIAGTFKFRTVGSWDDINLGYKDVKITGDAKNFKEDGGNLCAKAETTYKKITLKHDGDNWIADFQK